MTEPLVMISSSPLVLLDRLVTFLRPFREHVRVYRITVKIFLPLVSQHTAARACCCFDKSHLTFSFYLIECRCFTIYTLVKKSYFQFTFFQRKAQVHSHTFHIFVKIQLCHAISSAFFVDFRRAV